MNLSRNPVQKVHLETIEKVTRCPKRSKIGDNTFSALAQNRERDVRRRKVRKRRKIRKVGEVSLNTTPKNLNEKNHQFCQE